MSDTNLIHGRAITAMVNDNTSVKEILQLMGVEPTDEIVNEAMNHFALNGGNMNMSSLHDFLRQKEIMSKYKIDAKKMKRIADCRR